ncbi:MAG: hypothetical protein IJF59_05970, partial [Clostridia bacterium]|nr:hypothetical protein [Clostridia bacterium]
YTDYLFTMSFEMEGMYSRILPIYPQYERTLSVLEQGGVELPPALRAEELSSLTLSLDSSFFIDLKNGMTHDDPKLATKLIEVPGLTAERLRKAATVISIDSNGIGTDQAVAFFDHLFNLQLSAEDLTTADPASADSADGTIYYDRYGNEIATATKEYLGDVWFYLQIQITDPEVLELLVPYLRNGYRSYYNPFLRVRTGLDVQPTALPELGYRYHTHTFAANRLPAALYEVLKELSMEVMLPQQTAAS